MEDNDLYFGLGIIFLLIIIVLTVGLTINEQSKSPIEKCMEDCYSSEKTLTTQCKIRCIDVIPELADKIIIMYKEVNNENISN
jgi:hypothetical protein